MDFSKAFTNIGESYLSIRQKSAKATKKAANCTVNMYIYIYIYIYLVTSYRNYLTVAFMLVLLWVRFLEHCERNETQHNYVLQNYIYIILEKRILFGLLYFYFYFAYVISSAHRIGIYFKILIDILFFVYFCTNCYFTIDT